ncbi:MAG TPA: DUF934 domain-containing protein [Asticcacaulis sp.]|jgi:uncharacterized protein (DUF934 family)|nr:DUF934 domain-containing protein [Asticcacaulis sp.]
MSRPNSSYEPQLVNRAGETLTGDEIETLDFDRAVEELDGLNGSYAVAIQPGQDVRALLPFIDHIARFDIAFPGYRDGRGYSSARILREAGFTGAIRAVGDVLRDQLFYMLRCGFDEFLIKDAAPPEAIRAAAQRYATTYQSAADAAAPVWALRHRIPA